MKKILSGVLILCISVATFVGCAKTEAEKQAEAEKKANNDLLILLLILSASRASNASACSYYGTSGGCYSSAPYSCPNSNYCTSSSTCSNLSCDIASAGSQKIANQTSATCDTSKFECLIRKEAAK